jgi:pyruvate dehydrogenase E1 component beta subunit
VQEGTDVTLIAWGAMVVEAQKAAASLAEEGMSCEIIDVATLSPFNGEDILKSVEKTGRCVIVHEAPLTNGFGAEIAAQIAEHALLSLLAPVIRVTAPDIIVPLARLEDYYIPSSSQIINAVHKVLSYS